MTPAKNENIRTLLLSSTKPLLIKNGLNNWLPLNWPLSQWLDLFKNDSDATLEFRCGENNCSMEPQWESRCHHENLTPTQFITRTQDTLSTNKWMYFDYKNIVHWKSRVQQTDMNTPWNLVGFPEQGIDETTLWIGSKGAHTPCHMDAYGCNLVAQVIGRKQWILYPPSDPGIVATQSRIPYEESSIYSTVNFQCGKRILDSINLEACEPYIVTLDPGDILFVPHKWWHYVQHLTTGLSLNTWIPLCNMVESCTYLDEWLVQYLVRKFTQDLSKADKRKLINPNETDLLELSDGREEMCIEQLEQLLNRHGRHLMPSSHEERTGIFEQPSSNRMNISEQTSSKETNKNDPDANTNSSKHGICKDLNVEELTPASREQFISFCREQCACLQNDDVKHIGSENTKPNQRGNNSLEVTFYSVSNVKQKDPSPEGVIPSSKGKKLYERNSDAMDDTIYDASNKRVFTSSECENNTRRTNRSSDNVNDVESQSSRSDSFEPQVQRNKRRRSKSISSDSDEKTYPTCDTLMNSRQVDCIGVNQSHLIKAFSDPEVISLVREKLLQQLQLDVAGK